MCSKIPIMHLHGGETTLGAIDEAFRHSISKMAHLHCVATNDYKKRVIQSKMCLIMLGINVLVLISYGLKIYEGNSSFINLVLIACSIIECVLLFVARKAINKDENLVRSIDRIR